MSAGLDLLGWLGGGLGAVAYVLVSTRRIVADAVLFQGLNMGGAALLSVASFSSGALPSACMNVAWILFGVHSLATAGQRRRRREAHRDLPGDRCGRAEPDRLELVARAAPSAGPVATPAA